uniref:Sacsin-like n=1 Tax=Saccoglossus kowalevskii TaxID=10224 RepID=A0ABM0MHG6_SACKO|nr:PREDICTED: sacsin-like [Saccoglossus kowalevskii]
MDSSDSDEEFGQEVPPLYLYLKRILDKYPEGGQILKEIIQNADDAGATEVKFLYDNTEYPTDGLWSDKLKEFHGPALYAYNNAVFKDKDWFSIQRPEQSGKADDPLKVGRFGLGFNSVYHITDLPSILSGKYLGVFDPLETVFTYDQFKKKHYHKKPGKKWKLKGELLSKDHTPYSNQFEPYLGIFGCDEASFQKGKFNGTIFRFPLRKTESQLSGNIISKDRIMGPDGWITSFRTDVDLTLLFLKKIESISVYERSGQNTESTLLYSASIVNSVIDHVRIQKSKFLEQLKQNKEAQPLSIDVEIKLMQQFKEEVKRWVVVHQIPKSGLSNEFRCLADDDEIQLLPWVGVAVQISKTKNEQSDGRIFCFLPLPPSQTTGLPVHIHGYFGLGDNRRSIKWPDMESQQDKTARWNKLLTSEAIPEVYVKLITSLICEYKLEPKCVYAAWPDPCKLTTENWKLLLEKLLKQLLENDVFYTEAYYGSWIGLKKAIFNIPQRNISCTVQQDIVNMLLEHEQPIVTLPMHILEWLKASNILLTKVTPSSVRCFLKSIWHQHFERRTKLNILEYILADAQYSDLNGLHLLPLANGTFTSFSCVGDSRKVFIATTICPQYLLPNMNNRFLDGSLPQLLKSKLEDASEYTQLSILNPEIVVQNLRSALPSKWTEGSESTVMWSQDGDDQCPPPEWLSQFWNWFRCKIQLSITVLEGLPLIPLNNSSCTIELLKLESGPKAIFNRTSLSTLSEDIVNVVEHCGGFVIKEQLYYPQDSSFNKYIASPDATGVLVVLENIGIDVVEQKLKNNPILARPLCTFLSILNIHSYDEHFLTLRQLSIFGTILCDTCVSVSRCSLIAPNEYKDIPCNKIKKQMIESDDVNTLNLAKALGANQLEFAEYIENHILHEFDNGYFSNREVLKIMEWVLCRSQYDDIVKKYRCIQTRGGQLSKPCEIIDPDNSLLRMLLGESGLPVDTYVQPKFIKLIRRVGLMEESNVSPDMIYNIAMNLDCQRRKCTPDMMQKAHCLLEYVSKYPEKLNKHTTDRCSAKLLFNRLTTLAWLPCDVNRPKCYPEWLPWFADDEQNSQCLFTPTEVTSHEHCKQVGGVMPIIPVQYLNNSLYSTFQWQTLDGEASIDHVQKVVMQMKLIVDSAEEVVQNMLKPLEDMIFEIYSFLSKSNIEWVRHWINVKGGKTLKWIWHGRGFTSANNVAFTSNLHINLQPYLFTLPLTLAEEHSQLFKKMYIPKEFNPGALADVLHSIKKKHCRTDSSKDVESDLKLSCEIIHLLCKDSNLNDDIQKLILVPAKMHDMSKLKLVEVNVCLYCDREFLSDDLKDNSYYIVHDDIPNATARKLGMQPLSNHVAPTDNLGYDLAGPHESVINAIKRNLEMYKEGVDIFKELIQNADDAGASEIRFLIDHRQNTDVQLKLLDPGMKHCHGPALWSYNDAMFSSEDIRNICDIAAASKKDKLDKIGRFGLGFTSVYHVTDVPSVVSGSHIMIFDPRMTHLKSRIHNPSQPGIKLNLHEESHRQTLSVCVDQFQPYHEIFGCNISEDFKFNGTLFRLPLRNHYQASDQMENCITDKVYLDKHKLQQLIVQLRDSAPSLLVFTQSVKEMSIWELKTEGKTGADAVKMLTIKVNLIQQLPRQITSVTECPPTNKIEQLKNQSNILKATSKWLINVNGKPPDSTSLIEVVFESKCLKDWKTKNEMWLVSACASSGAAFEAAQTDDGRKQGVLPCGGVAAKLKSEVNGLNPSPVVGQLYSFLPVAVQTGLPIHLNAPFALQPNRRHIWSKSSVSGKNTEFEGEWNLCLMIDVLKKAFINLLIDMIQLRMEGTVGKHDFHTLWPNLESTETDFHPFVKAFYEGMSGNQNSEPPRIIYNESQWVTLNDCLFLGTDLQQETTIAEHAMILLNEYCKPKKVIQLNKAVEYCIIRQVNQENVYNITRFYKDVFFKYTEDISLEIRNSMLLYLLDIRIGAQKDISFDVNLKKAPCFPVSPDGFSIDVPQNLVHPESLVGKLFDDSDGRFPHGAGFLSKERLFSLIDLGMATDELSWEDLCGRAESVMDVFKSYGFFAAVSRTKIIFKVMNNLLKQGKMPHLNDIKRLTRTSFLPVMTKPNDYPCEWFGENKLSNGDNLYRKECLYYLGSVAQILDECCIDSADVSQEIMQILGVRSKALVDDVLIQLQHVSMFPKAKKTMLMCSEIYQYLQTVLCEEVATDDGDTIVQITTGYERKVEKLKSMKVFLVDEMFVGADQLAFTWMEMTAPYLYKVPNDLVKYKKLLQVCGVRKSFSIGDYLDVLMKLKEKNGAEPLDEHELRITLLILKRIDFSDNIVYAPDTDRILRDIKELTYDDAPWLFNKAQFTYAHHEINWKQADRLGIIAARKKRAKEFTLPLGCAQRFAYPGESEIFKELLQNADDAKATELHIIYDPRSHSTDKIVSESWKPIQQSPAICVYNNQIFSDDDIAGVQQVGIGAKSADAHTTGQYGIGFNSVYHLTDCPSFLSDDHQLGVFDPHLKYVPDATHDYPGILYKPVNILKENFGDMLSGFLGEYFSLKGGTMFRLPLRQNAYSSKISSKTYSDKDIRHMLNRFENEACDCLLFLNNVEVVTLSEILNTGEMKQLYKAEAKLFGENRLRREDIATHMLNHKKMCVTDIPQKLVDYNLQICDSKNRTEKWLVVQQFGFYNTPDVEFSDEELGKLLPRVGVAALVDGHKGEEKNYTHSPKTEMKKRFNAYCFLPLPIATDLPVHVNGHFALDRSRRYIWSDAGTHQTVRSIWNKTLVESALAHAYASLIMLAGHKYLTANKQEKLEWYHNLFPSYSSQNKTEAGVAWSSKGIWSYLSARTLQIMSTDGMHVLPLVRQRDGCAELTWHEPVNEDDQVYFNCLVEKNDADLRIFLLKSGFKLISSTIKIYNAFINAEVAVKQVSPEAVIAFMCPEKCHIGRLPCSISQTTYGNVNTFKSVLEYILNVMEHPNDLTGLPVLLREDNSVDVFHPNKLHFLSHYAGLLPSIKSKFVSRDVLNLLETFQKKNDDDSTTLVWKDFTPQDLHRYIGTVFPVKWCDVGLHLNLDVKCNTGSILARMVLLWNYLCSRKEENVLDSLLRWPIIPTTNGMFISPSQGKTVLSLLEYKDSFGLQRKVIDFLRKVGCLEIKFDLVSENITTHMKTLLKPYVASPSECQDILTLFEYMMNMDLIKFHNVSKEDSSIMLQYFQEDVQSYDHNSLTTLKKLPFYEKTDGHLSSLDAYQKYHLLSVRFPEAEQDKWTYHCRCIFLKPSHHLQLLQQTLGATAITAVDVYLKYIIPNFNLLTVECRLTHITYLRNTINWASTERTIKQLISALSKVKFIKAADGSMQSADYFFDGLNEVFKVMVEKRRLLPDLFIAYEWRDFLVKLGFNVTVTPDLFLEYANEVASEAVRLRSCDMKVVLEKSQMLAKELSVNESLHYPTFLKEVSTIKFIPSVPIREDLLEIYPLLSGSSTDSTMFICLRGNVSSLHVKLSWSNSSLLPDWAIPKKSSHIPRSNEVINLHECLGILDKPSVDTVISHCQNVCHHLAGKNSAEKQHTIPKIRKLLAEVLEDVYDFLRDYQNKSHLMSRLHNTPLVLVDQQKVLVCANQLAYKFDHLKEDDLHPYMYVPPRSLGSYEHFLKRLGAEESATFRQYSNVLSQIHSECENEIMGPNELGKAKKATKGLFYYLAEDNKRQCNVYNKLYLPSITEKMKLSTDLFYGKDDLLKRINPVQYEFALQLHECDCPEDMEFDLLPENLRPKNISNFVVAKVDPQCECCIAGKTCLLKEYIEDRMKSPEFAQCIIRLVRHQHKKMIDENIESKITMLKTKIKVCCVTELRTKLFNQKQNTYIEMSEQHVKLFLDDEQMLYISHSDEFPANPTLLCLLAGTVNRIISYQIRDTRIITALLASKIENFHDLITNFDIPELQTQRKAIQENKHAPGKSVPLDIHHLLDDDPINIFRKGEIVALKRLIDDGEDTDICDYIYAEIREVISNDADNELGLATKYNIYDGSQETVVSGNDLYKFLRPTPPTGQASLPDTRSLTVQLEEAKNIIEKTLYEASKMPKEECNKIVRRLYKKWHPDKNPNNSAVATAAFQYLRQQLDIMEGGGITGENYRRQYDRWNAEARNQRSQSERYYREYGRHYQSGRFSKSNIPPSFNRSTPMPREARVWFKQAKCDLQDASARLESINPSAEWVCFQVHQAAEKALKAAKFATDGDPMLNCTNLRSLMHAVQFHPDCPPGVEEDVAELVRNHCDFNDTRYPQRLETPNERYKIREAKDAVKCAQRLLDKLKQFIGIQRF